MAGQTIHPSYPALYRAAIKQAAARAVDLVVAMLERAARDMPAASQRQSDPLERAQLALAAEALRERTAALVDAFPAAVLTEIATALADDRAGTLSFDSLPLLGEEQLQEDTDMLRAAESVALAGREPLGELEALLAAAQGRGASRRHPLRPEVFVRALRRALQLNTQNVGMRRRWLRHLGEAMGEPLAEIYRDVVTMLRHQGVQAAPAAPAAPSVDAQSQINLRELQRLLAGRFDSPGVAVPAFKETEFSQTVPAAYEQLREMRKVDQVIQQLRQRQAAMPAEPSDSRTTVRVALREQARRPAQALGLEVVQLMIETLASDQRLLPPVQEAIRELESALMRLALADPRFFSDRQHPARELLEQVTQRSLAWADAQDPGFEEFVGTLREAVEALQESRTMGPEVFQIALDTLQGAWAEAQPRTRRTREKAVRALLRAEQRNLLAERIAQQLRERPEAAGAPQEVLTFLSGPWAQAMAQARLLDNTGAEDPGRYTAAAATLLRSVQPALALRVFPHRQALAERLRHGLASIDYQLADAQRWLETFDALQVQAVRHADETRDEPMPAAPEGLSDTWLAPLEAHDAGFLPPPELEVGNAALWTDDLPRVDLQPGAWVDLLGGEGWERWQLTWASPHGMLFMFTQARGATLSMTQRALQQRLASGGVRIVSSQAVVDSALDEVARAAWRNSTT